MADVPQPRTVPFGLIKQATGPGVYLQQSGGALAGFYTSVIFGNSTVAVDAAGNAVVTPQFGAINDKTILSNISGASAIPVGNTLSAILDDILGNTQGQIITRNAGVWTVLAPGTAGQALLTGGPSANVAWGAVSGGSSPVCGRLTLTSGVPVTTTDVTGATTIYFTPYKGNQLQLWDGAAWTTYAFVETALALGTLTAALPYDVFAFQNAGTLTLELLAWSSASARATAVTIQDGRWCKSGDKTRLLLGTFYTASTTTTEDSTLRRYVSNVFNAVPRELAVREAAASSTYSSATPRQANANAGNQVEAVFSVPGNSIDVSLLGIVSNNVSTTGGVSIGEDSTVASSPSALSGYPTYTGGNVSCGVTTRLCKQPTPGWHRYVWLESCSSAAAITFTYSNATSTGNMVQTGLEGMVFA